MDELKDECERRLLAMITVESVCAILMSADLHNVSTLKKHCLNFIVNNSDKIISRETTSAWQLSGLSARSDLINDLFYQIAVKKALPP